MKNYYGYVQKKGEHPTHLIKCGENYLDEIRQSIHNTLVTLPIKDFIPVSSAIRKSNYIFKNGNYEDISYIYYEEIKSIISSLYKEIDNDKH